MSKSKVVIMSRKFAMYPGQFNLMSNIFRLSTIVIFSFVSLFVKGQVLIPGDYHNPIQKSADSTTLSLYESVPAFHENGFRWNDVYFKTSYNSEYVRSYNDGAVWKGVGFTPELHAGFSGKVWKISYCFNPVVFLSQNKNLNYPDTLSNINKFAYPYSNSIDWVHRYGTSSFTQFHLGQSEVKLELGQFVASVGTQNYSLGPAVYNPILLSRQAGGFPHLRVGIKPTHLTKNKKIAKVEASLIYGLLRESDYYDENPDNDKRYFNGLFLAFSPSILPGLTLGLNRVLYKQTRYFQNHDIISPLFIIDNGVINGDTLSPNDSFDQMASFTLEWNFQNIGFRTYVEFAKNDFTSDGAGLRPALAEPDHTRGYTIGFEKTIFSKEVSELKMTYEHTNLSIGHRSWRPTPPYYTHGINRQGYTNDGQIIGAGIGPGGNSDNLSFSFRKNTFSSYLLLQRIEHDRDYFVNNVRNSNLHNMEYTAFLSAQKEFQKYALFIEGTLSKNYSKNYGYQDIVNLSFGFGGRLKLQL